MDVLDVGCGSGSITAGIADTVAPGLVVGIDRDPDLIEEAGVHLHGRPNLRFQVADAHAMTFESAFDVVAAARLLQWLTAPMEALLSMRRAVRPGGLLALLDYDHAAMAVHPSPSPAFAAFYGSFLEWRESLGFDNSIGSRLSSLMQRAGIRVISVSREDEVSSTGDVTFPAATSIWKAVMRDIGPQIVRSGFLAQVELDRAQSSYEAWCEGDALMIRLVLWSAVGRAMSER